MQDSFKLFERKGEKGISFVGMKEALNTAEVDLNDEEIKQIIKELDEDKDGKISYEEYKKVMTRFTTWLERYWVD